MHRRDLRPLPAAASRNVEWVAARYEVRINDLILAWHGQAPANHLGQRTLTAEQHSELQNLLVGMAVQLGEAEGREYLNTTSSPRQFELEIAEVMDAIASETRERWGLVVRDFLIQPQMPEDGRPESDFSSQIREALKPAARRLVRDAWSAHERRLAAECACPAPGDSIPAQQIPSQPPSGNQTRRELVAKHVEKLRMDRGMSVEQLAADAHLDKKTVVAILHARRTATPRTLKKIADALGVKASDLAS